MKLWLLEGDWEKKDDIAASGILWDAIYYCSAFCVLANDEAEARQIAATEDHFNAWVKHPEFMKCTAIAIEGPGRVVLANHPPG